MPKFALFLPVPYATACPNIHGVVAGSLVYKVEHTIGREAGRGRMSHTAALVERESCRIYRVIM